MQRIERSFEVDVPVHAAYEQWKQFEPRWRASIAGEDAGWDAEATGDDQGEVLAWRSASGPAKGGRVRFQPLGPERTRVALEMDCEPQDGAALSRDVDAALHDFRQRIAPRGTGLAGRQAAGNPAGHGVAPGGAGGAYPGSTGGTPGAGGGKPGTTPGGAPGAG